MLLSARTRCEHWSVQFLWRPDEWTRYDAYVDDEGRSCVILQHKTHRQLYLAGQETSNRNTWVLDTESLDELVDALTVLTIQGSRFFHEPERPAHTADA